MNNLWRNLLLGTTLGVSLLAVAPQSAKADSYWTNHWGWYDNTYRPYYQRQYYYNPYPPRTYYGPSYSSGYYTAPYSTPYNDPITADRITAVASASARCSSAGGSPLRLEGSALPNGKELARCAP